MKYWYYLMLLSCCSLFTQEHYKYFVIDICSYNNKKWVAKNLTSAIRQKYPKEFFHIYYTDDCSDDGTGEYVERYIKRYKLENRITLIRNPYRKHALANHYAIIHRCDDDAIIIHLDGDDEFAHCNVLSYLNEIYQDPSVWLTYGAMSYRPSWRAKEIPPCLPITPEMIQNKTYRTILKGPYHPRAFYVWLAKLVRLESLLCPHNIYDMQHQFFPSCADWALMFPMLEMAGIHSKCIQDTVLTIYNVENPYNVYKCDGEKQDAAGAIIRSQKPYDQLSAPCKHDFTTTGPVLLLFCTEHTVGQLHTFLEHWFLYAYGCPEMYIFVPDTVSLPTVHNQKAIHWVVTNEYTFQERLIALLQTIPYTSIVCSTPEFVLNEPVAFNSAAQLLQKTYAYGFYCKTVLPDCKQGALITDTVYARCLYAPEAHIYNTFALVIYTKAQMLTCLACTSCSSTEALEKAWQEQAMPQCQVGLFLKPTKKGLL